MAIIRGGCLILLLLWGMQLQAQNRKIDTSMTFGTAGYKVRCNNKSAEKNSVTISAIGFSNSAQKDASFDIKGLIKSAAVEDFNNDGFPDLVLFVYSGVTGNMGTVIGIASQNNESMRPVFFPDILDDPKLRMGYKGFDTFKVVQGTLFRKFPLYDVADSTQAGSYRNIQYGVLAGENGVLKFKVLRSYDSKQ